MSERQIILLFFPLFFLFFSMSCFSTFAFGVVAVIAAAVFLPRDVKNQELTKNFSPSNNRKASISQSAGTEYHRGLNHSFHL